MHVVDAACPASLKEGIEEALKSTHGEIRGGTAELENPVLVAGSALNKPDDVSWAAGCIHSPDSLAERFDGMKCHVVAEVAPQIHKEIGAHIKQDPMNRLELQPRVMPTCGFIFSQTALAVAKE
jgi:hypothetical protein